jgi:CubicO group peptidase (beta-lactamase class C family)
MILGALVTFVAATQPPSAPVLTRADLERWLDGLVPYALHQSDIAGLIVSVVKDGELLLQKGYGYADVSKRIPMDPERTVIRPASVSKTFTATAVLQQVEQGKLDLDRDINQYLDFTIPPAFGKPITLRHLLTHTAGFEETAYKRYVPPLTLRQHLLMIPERIYPPGEVPAYSNYGVNLAGYIVERVSGETIADYVERHILAPLGMAHSAFHQALPEALRPFEAKNYSVASSGEPFPPNLIAEMSPVEWPAGGLSTTAHDMTRFMLAHLQQGRYGDQQVLQPETLRLMHAPAFVPIPGAQPIALGLFRTDYHGHRVIGHSGDGEGFHAEMRLLPEQNVGLFIAMNSDGVIQGILPAAFTLRAMLLEQFMDRYFPTPAAAEEPTVPTAKEHARLAAGEYVWSRQQKGDFQEAFALIARFTALKVTIRDHPDGTIETPALVSFKSGPPQTWREVGPFVWREVGGNGYLVMKVQDGQVESFASDAIASAWVNLRVPYLWSAGLNVPLLALAAGALLVIVLLWPAGVIVRRHYGLPPELAGRDRRAYRLTRIAAVLGLLYLLGWAIALAADFASIRGAWPWIRLIQLVGLFCVAGAAIAVWNAWRTWRRAGSWWARVWSLVPALGLVELVWFSFAFHLISLSLS